ncbi:MAG: phage major tail tube protein [Oligoflexales bacterium]
MDMPHKLSNFNLYVAGKGLAGTINEIVLPKITYETEDHLSGGMSVSTPIEKNLAPLQADFTLAEYDADIIKLMGFKAGGPINVTARGVLKRDDSVIPVVAVLEGVITELDLGTWKRGDDSEMKFTLKANYYRLESAGETLIEIDAKNLIQKIGGVDELELVRAALLL